MQNYRNVNTAAFTFKEETDLTTPSQQNNKSPSEKSSLPHREGLGEQPGWVHAPALQLPTAGRKLGERRSAALLTCHTWSTELSLQPRVTLCVKCRGPVGDCVFSFWSHTVSEHRYCTTVHKSVFKKLLKGILFQCASLPHSYYELLCHLSLFSNWSRKTGHLFFLLEGSLMRGRPGCAVHEASVDTTQRSWGINSLLKTLFPGSNSQQKVDHTKVGQGVARRSSTVMPLLPYVSQSSHSVVSDSLWPHGWQHARPPCPSPTPRVYSNSCPLSWWCHPTISSSVIPFSSRLQSFRASGSFHTRWPKYWSFSFSISPSKYSGLISFRMDWFDLPEVQGILKSILQHHSSKASILRCSALVIVQLSHPYMTTGKTIALTRWTFVGRITSLLFNMLSRLVIAFLPRSKRLLISWLQSQSTVILEPPK